MPEPPLYRSRYPGFDVLDGAQEWDARTREVVLGRVREPPPIRFFDEQERRALEAFAEVILPQDDRPPELRVPLVNFLDARLHQNESYGFRYEPLPPDPELWRLIAASLDEEARRVAGRAYADLSPDARETLWSDVVEGDARAAGWARIDMDLALPLILWEFASHYYGHPYGWNEIGFPGPRFPRIYARLVRDNPAEPQEARP